MKKLLLTLAVATAITTTTRAGVELENPTPGAFGTAWVGQFKEIKKPDQAPNKVFADKEGVFSAENVKGVAWNQVLIRWEGYVEIKDAGEYVINAQSFGAINVQAGVKIDLAGTQIIYYPMAYADKAQGAKKVALQAGLNKIAVWMYADDTRHKVKITYRKDEGLTEKEITPATMIFDKPEE